jgi:VWFA-related protein
MRTTWRVLVIPTLCTLALAGSFGAQEEQFFDAVDVRVSSVEVVVTDRDGKPITDLRPEEFQILEDGVLQPITHFSFQEEGRAESAEGEAAPVDSGLATVPAKDLTSQLHLAIFVDDNHLSVGNRNKVFERLHGELKNVLRPGDLVMIARLGERLEVEQGFTPDAVAVGSTLSRLAEKSSGAVRDDAAYRRILRDMQSTATAAEDSLVESGMGGAADQKLSPDDLVEISAESQAREILTFAEERLHHTRQTIQALQVAVDSLAGLPGRKALIFLTDGLPVRPAEGLAEAWREKYEIWARSAGRGDLTSEMSSARSRDLDAGPDLDQLSVRAAESKVAFYILSPGSPQATGHVSAEFATAPSAGGGAIRTAAAIEAFNSDGALLELAEKTGGVARMRSFQIEGLLRDVRSDFSTFYSLGYNPPTAEAKAAANERKARRAKKPKKEETEAAAQPAVQVKVLREDAVVRYAQRLANDDPTDQLRALTLSALYHGLSDNTLAAELVPQPGKKKDKNTIALEVHVRIPFEKLLLLPQEANHVGRVTLFVAAQDRETQKLSAMRRVELPLQVPNDRLLEILAGKATYPLQLEMSPGLQRLAVGLRDQLGRVSGTVFLELDVQDGGGVEVGALAGTEAASGQGP